MSLSSLYANVEEVKDNIFAEDDHRFSHMVYSVKNKTFTIYNYKTPEGEYADISFQRCMCRILHDSKFMKQFHVSMENGGNDKVFLMTEGTFFNVNPATGNKMYTDFTNLQRQLPENTLDRFTAVKYLLGAIHIPVATYDIVEDGRSETVTLKDVTIDQIPFTFKGKAHMETNHKDARKAAFADAKRFITDYKKRKGVTIPHYGVVFELFVGTAYENKYKRNGKEYSSTNYNLGMAVLKDTKTKAYNLDEGYYSTDTYNEQSKQLMEMVDYDDVDSDGKAVKLKITQAQAYVKDQVNFLNRASLVTHTNQLFQEVCNTYAITYDDKSNAATETKVIEAEVVDADSLLG